MVRISTVIKSMKIEKNLKTQKINIKNFLMTKHTVYNKNIALNQTVFQVLNLKL